MRSPLSPLAFLRQAVRTFADRRDYRYILGHSGAKAVLVDPGFADLAASLRQAVPGLQRVLLSARDAPGGDAGHDVAPDGRAVAEIAYGALQR